MLRRTSVLIALGLLLGLVMGTWAARADMYLPLLFSPPAAAEPPPAVRMLDTHAWAEGACAELVNETPYTVRILNVTIYLRDAGGAPVGSVRLARVGGRLNRGPLGTSVAASIWENGAR